MRRLVNVMDIRDEAARTERWDRRFLGIAQSVSEWSKDPSTRCGAVIVRPDRTICSLGYNGFPRGCDDDPSLYEDRDLKYDRVVHAELNAILSARELLLGYTLYSWPPGQGPTCARCATAVIQVGIRRVVFVFSGPDSPFGDRWVESQQRGIRMYQEVGVEVVGYPMASGGLAGYRR